MRYHSKWVFRPENSVDFHPRDAEGEVTSGQWKVGRTADISWWSE